ncbi:9950_t:CDS:2 [Scutellospora calospora]|uniref:9950_t:CDS:1 n=1 Tax=Scutellospora calospora TaxID=85575 RepID=A0ACA9LME1_9GLOM|nr:9950_t:CDS:2 [Scutellospora calospora]
MKILKKLFKKFNKKSKKENLFITRDYSTWSNDNKEKSFNSISSLSLEHEKQFTEIKFCECIYFTNYKNFKDYLIDEGIINSSLKIYENTKNKRLNNGISERNTKLIDYCLEEVNEYCKEYNIKYIWTWNDLEEYNKEYLNKIVNSLYEKYDVNENFVKKIKDNKDKDIMIGKEDIEKLVSCKFRNKRNIGFDDVERTAIRSKYYNVQGFIVTNLDYSRKAEKNAFKHNIILTYESNLKRKLNFYIQKDLEKKELDILYEILKE